MKNQGKFFDAKTNRLLILLLAASVMFCAACGARNDNSDSTNGLVVVNAPQNGTVRRVLIGENTDVQQNAVLLEIVIAPNVQTPATDNNRSSSPPITPANSGDAIEAAEQNLERAAVEAQRVETLVESNAAPQSQLDAARAEYERAQRRLDELRRRPPNPPIHPAASPNESITNEPIPAENIVAVRAPVTGNVRVVSVRAGQPVKDGQPVATISVAR